MEGASAGQNTTEAVQEGFHRGLIGHGAGRIQQGSISICGARHTQVLSFQSRQLAMRAAGIRSRLHAEESLQSVMAVTVLAYR